VLEGEDEWSSIAKCVLEGEIEWRSKVNSVLEGEVEWRSKQMYSALSSPLGL